MYHVMYHVMYPPTVQFCITMPMQFNLQVLLSFRSVHVYECGALPVNLSAPPLTEGAPRPPGYLCAPPPSPWQEVQVPDKYCDDRVRVLQADARTLPPSVLEDHAPQVRAGQDATAATDCPCWHAS